jgi:hypothetical protein
MYSVYFTRENREKIAMLPLIQNTYFVVSMPMVHYRLSYRYKRLVLKSQRKLSYSLATLNVMSIESMTVLIHLMDVYSHIYIISYNKMSFVYIRKIMYYLKHE